MKFKEDKDNNSRKYKHVEKTISTSGGYDNNYELKACRITNKEKAKIYLIFLKNKSLRRL